MKQTNSASSRDVILISTITMLGYILGILIYPLSNTSLSSKTVSEIAILDTNLMMITGWLGFGINAIAARDIAVNENTGSIIKKVQSARITMSLFFSAIGIIVITIGEYSDLLFWLVLIISPILALNYDFALYGMGKPLSGAIASFIRLSLPILIFLPLIFIGIANTENYLSLTILFIFLSSVFTSKQCNGRMLYSLDKKFLSLYIQSFSVGIAGIALGLARYGFINLYSSKVASNDLVVLVTFLKINLFSIACKRMLIQVFYTQLLNTKVSNYIHIFCFSASFFAFIFITAFPEFTSKVFFNDIKYIDVCYFIAASFFSTLLFSTSDAKILLLHKEKWMASSTIIISTIALMVLFFNRDSYQLKDILLVIIFFELSLSLSYYLIYRKIK